MSTPSRHRRSLAVACHLLLASLLMTCLEPTPVSAQAADPAIRRGDAVVTGFAGTLPPGPDLPADVHPLDRTVIDLEGATVRIFDLTQLGGGPEGQLSDAPVKRVLKARDIGHVFGVAFDGDGKGGPPSIYLAATSAHGLQLVAPGPDGRPQRVMTGRPGAEWMPGLFGQQKGGGPGSIWKVDGRTGAVTLFADIRTGDLENSGAGLGGIAFDPRSRHLYVSDLETGLVWRLDPAGRLLDVFDHGTQGRADAGLPLAAYDPATRTDRTEETFNTEIPETWGFAPHERRVVGLAVEGGRLYYSVADGPKVWSVGLNEDGSFAGGARLEIDVTGTPAGNAVTGILFDGPHVLYLAQRGAQQGSYDYATFMRPQEAMAMRYRWSEAERRWVSAREEYAVGMPPEHYGGLGGVALNYGYDRFGNIDYGRCRQTLWLTGEHLRSGSDIVRVTRGGPRLVHGLQGIYKSRVRPANEPPFEAWYVDYDADFAEVEVHGHIGNVAIFGPCEPAAGVTFSADRVEIPVWSGGPNITVEKRCDPAPLGARVRCRIVVRNTGDAAAGGTIELLDQTRILWGVKAGGLVPVAGAAPDGAEWACATKPSGELACSLPAALLGVGGSRELTLWIDTGPLALAGSLGFRNCVTLDHPAGKGKACAEGGASITVAKTGPAHCEPGDDCKFAVTLTNKSGSPFAGEVLLTDRMLLKGQPVEAPITKIEPPLACAVQPAALPFDCLAKVALAPGESLTHWITVEMPGPGPIWVQNCFGVADPWLAADQKALDGLLLPVKFKGIGEPAGQPACAWVKLDDGKHAAPAKKPGPISPYMPVLPALVSPLAPPLGVLPPGSYCADGRAPLATGRCPCPASAPWDPDTGTCRWRPVCWDKARLAPDGHCCPRGTVWWPQAQSCRTPPVVGCTDVWRRRPDGTCCPAGTRFRDGACRPPVVAEPCPPGHTRLLSGACIKLPILPPVVGLPGCADGKPRLANGRCQPVACPLNAPFNPRSGRCERIVGGGECKAGQVRNPVTGQCGPLVGCPGRLVRDGAGKCVPPVVAGVGAGPGPGSGPVACGPNQKAVDGKCVGPSVPVVPGKVGVPPLPVPVKPPETTLPPVVKVPPVVRVPPATPPAGKDGPGGRAPVVKVPTPPVKVTTPPIRLPQPSGPPTRVVKPPVKETPAVRTPKPERSTKEATPARIIVKPEKKPVPRVERPAERKAEPARINRVPSRPQSNLGFKPPTTTGNRAPAGQREPRGRR